MGEKPVSHDLLTDPILQSDRGWHSLPGLMAAMARGEVARFPALRPHQRPAWHMFLVQLGVLALEAAGRDDLPENEANWREALSALTPDFPNGEPWHLVVAERTKPAFLQPPDPGGLKWTEVATPDALDMLITARNHDLKREIAINAAPQDWIFALVSLQTMEGFGGAGNYGIARMNGGSSSRVLMGLAPLAEKTADVSASKWWARDLIALRQSRASAQSGHKLLWILPWAGDVSLDLASLDPLALEVCRRIRMHTTAGPLRAERSTSGAARVAGKEAKGNTGDPWAPVQLKDSKSLTLGDRDWSYDLLVSLLYSGEWRLPLLARARPDEEARPMALIFEAFARGNSKTDGFKSRIVPIPKAMVAEMFGTRPLPLARDILEDIKVIDQSLRNGLATVAAGGDRGKLKEEHYMRSRPARGALRHQADRIFFPELWTRLGATSTSEIATFRRAFLDRLAAIARAEFSAALSSIPCASLMRPRAELRGRDAMERSIRFAMQGLIPQEGANV